MDFRNSIESSNQALSKQHVTSRGGDGNPDSAKIRTVIGFDKILPPTETKLIACKYKKYGENINKQGGRNFLFLG